MSSEPDRVEAILHAALDLSGPDERSAFLDRECGDDRDLRARIAGLVAMQDDPGIASARTPAGSSEPAITPMSSTETDATSDPDRTTDHSDATASHRPASTPDEDRTTDHSGRGALLGRDSASPLIGSFVAGRYKIGPEIGEGGMGSVYLAEQTQPVRRQVALKLIKAGMDSRTVLARFESERQALALMDHPNIAKVLDAGTTEQGRPFFVMELVKGIPLTDYCDRYRLALPERLALFRQICSAVQHAHQKGIIHRDLKPTNILVEAHDGKPVPKVIDFGLAKATSGLRLTEDSLQSAFGSVAGTPLYMAPEQASFNAIDVDTRADIYALGAILYELLSGSTPIQRQTMKRAALDEMLRIIREVEPPTPSSRISSSEALPNIAASRHIEPARLSRFVRGDLDWIVMKALAKERQRRYDSPMAMADDVERFTNHEPVSAGPPTALYRVQKFVRRNRGRVVAASLVLLALVGGVVGTTLGLVEANHQRGVAEARRKEADQQRDIADDRRREADRQKDIATDQEQQARKRLAQRDKANEVLLSIFRDLDPRTGEKETPALSERLGNRLDLAMTELEGEVVGDPLEVARMQMALGQSQLGLGHAEKGIALFKKAIATLTSSLGPEHPDTLIGMGRLASGYQDAGRLDRAIPLGEETLALMKAKLGPNDPETLAVMGNLGWGYKLADRLDRALPMLEETLALKRSKLGPAHSGTLISMNNLAAAYVSAGRLDRAIPLHEETLALKRSKLGLDHPSTVMSMSNLAASYWKVGKLDRSIPLFEESLKIHAAKLGANHPGTWSIRANLGVNYRDAGRLPDALPLLEGAHRASRKEPSLRWVGVNLLVAYGQAGLSDKATALARELIADGRAEFPSGSPQWDNLLVQTGGKLLEAKSWGPAELILRECLTNREKAEPEDWSTFNIKSMFGASLLGQKKTAEAEDPLRSGYAGMKTRAGKMPPQSKFLLRDALDRLIELAEATGKDDEAKAWKDERAKFPAAPVQVPPGRTKK